MEQSEDMDRTDSLQEGENNAAQQVTLGDAVGKYLSIFQQTLFL